MATEKKNDDVTDKESFFESIRPGAKEVGSLKYYWKYKRKEFFRGLLATLRDRPLLCFAVAYFLVYPSLSSFFGVFVILLLSQFLNELLGQAAVIANQHRIVEGAIAPLVNDYPDIKIFEHKVSEYMDRFNYFDMSVFLVESFQKLMPVKSIRENPMTLDDTLSVYVFETDLAMLENVSTYPSPLRQSYIIFDHRPEECGFFQRFMILHETAHALLRIAKLPFYSQFGRPLIIINLAIINFLYKISAWGIAIIIVAYLINHKERRTNRENANLRDEVFCDSMALMYLQEKDFQRLASYTNLPNQLRDTSLSDEHNRMRLETLRDNINARKNGDDLFDKVEGISWLNPKPSILILVLTNIIIAVAVLFAAARSYLLLKASVLLIVLFLLFLWSHRITARNGFRLEGLLSNFENNKEPKD